MMSSVCRPSFSPNSPDSLDKARVLISKLVSTPLSSLRFAFLQEAEPVARHRTSDAPFLQTVEKVRQCRKQFKKKVDRQASKDYRQVRYDLTEQYHAHAFLLLYVAPLTKLPQSPYLLCASKPKPRTNLRRQATPRLSQDICYDIAALASKSDATDAPLQRPQGMPGQKGRNLARESMPMGLGVEEGKYERPDTRRPQTRSAGTGAGAGEDIFCLG